jgi:hypothetical protein
VGQAVQAVVGEALSQAEALTAQILYLALLHQPVAVVVVPAVSLVLTEGQAGVAVLVVAPVPEPLIKVTQGVMVEPVEALLEAAAVAQVE